MCPFSLPKDDETTEPVTSADQRAVDIAAAFIEAEFDDDEEAVDWLRKNIAAALKEAEGRRAALRS